jgi:hypothetical protein
MATAKSQKKWRDKNRLVKTQLNVMARESVHESLDKLAQSFNLRGKGEAVSFAAFMVNALSQRADYSTEAARILDDFVNSFHNNRDIYSN